jgi:hypothetical protein
VDDPEAHLRLSHVIRLVETAHVTRPAEKVEAAEDEPRADFVLAASSEAAVHVRVG